MRINDLWTTRHDTDEQILEAAERILARRLERQGAIKDPTAACDLLRMRIGHLPDEVFGCIFLDTQHNILAIEELFQGTIDGAEIHPRIIAKRALELGAAAILAYHNHPSGNTEPSSADRAVTAQIKHALALIDVRTIDHIVVTAVKATSMAARGWV